MGNVSSPDCLSMLSKIEFTDVAKGGTYRNLPVATCEFARREQGRFYRLYKGVQKNYLPPTCFDNFPHIHIIPTVQPFHNPSLSSRSLANRRASAVVSQTPIHNHIRSPIKIKTDLSHIKPPHIKACSENQNKKQEMGTTFLPQTQRGVSRTSPHSSRHTLSIYRVYRCPIHK